jgi:hypothetical protein
VLEPPDDEPPLEPEPVPEDEGVDGVEGVLDDEDDVDELEASFVPAEPFELPYRSEYQPPPFR